MTVITISALGENASYTINNREFDYLIADPRENAGYSASDLTDYWSGTYNNGRTVAWTQNQASQIKRGSTTTTNYIAPRLLVASRWSRTVDWGTGNGRYVTAQKRCATYQEAGYPAGRWRLPTEAEIMFMANLQKFQFIDELYSNGGQNITASGSVLQVHNAANNYAIEYWAQVTNNVGSSCRCVYDLWYWGDDPVEGALSTYTIGSVE